MEELFPILIAVCAAAAVWAGWVLVVQLIGSDKRKLAQRLSAANLSGSAGPAQLGSIVQQEEAGLPPMLANIGFFRRLHRQLLHANPDASLPRFLWICGGLGMGALVIVWLLTDSMLIAGPSALGAAYLPCFNLARKRNKRQKLLSEQLPEALEFLQRILRAGHSLSTGMSMMADELPKPLSGEFRRCYDQHTLGQPLEQCLRDMAKRIASTDFAFFVTAVLIQRQTGGDLSQVLGNISGMVRQRIRLQQYVKAKTAEGRFTGYILVAFPIFLFFIAASMNADYKKNLLEESCGLTLLGIAGTLIVMGLFAIRKITTVKV